MVNCNNCAYQGFCYGCIKDYCPRYTPSMITYDDKTTNQSPDNYVSYYTNGNSV